jgi:small GTP-binding protein
MSDSNENPPELTRPGIEEVNEDIKEDKEKEENKENKEVKEDKEVKDNKVNRDNKENNNLDFKYEILPEDQTNFDLSFKIIVIGDSGVGKSCLTNNAVKNIFDDAYNATVGFEFFTFNVKINGKIIKLQIWDTCGQELYRSLITNFYRNSSLAIMVYAINSKESFENIEMWLRELRTHSNPDAKVFLIGNKIDLENQRQVEKEKGEQFCKENKLNLFMESSAKTGVNAQNIFIQAAKTLYDDYINYQKKTDEAGKTKNNTNQNLMQNQNQLINRKRIDNKPRKNQGGCC